MKMENKHKMKFLQKEIEELTILIATAREEGDDDEHKRVVNEIMKLFKAKHEEVLKEIKEELVEGVSIDYIKRIIEKHLEGK